LGIFLKEECSWGSPFFNQALYDVMAENPEMLFICAAGNVNGGQPVYPAAFGLQNILAVSSADNNGHVDAQSSYGDYVNLFAPGVNIYTSTLNDGNEFVSGTSMAAAFVTGAASIYKQHYPEATGIDIAAAIRLSLSYRGVEDPITSPEADSNAPMLDVGAMLEILPGAELPLEERNFTAIPNGFDLSEYFTPYEELPEYVQGLLSPPDKYVNRV
jgi:subtilisin family serine protease